METSSSPNLLAGAEPIPVAAPDIPAQPVPVVAPLEAAPPLPPQAVSPPAEAAKIAQLESVAKAAAETVASAAQDPVLKEIETILAKGLAGVFKELPEGKRGAFKVAGERLAREIRSGMLNSKMSAHRTLKSVRAWLQIVPGINQYYLVQEAKIKTDDVLMFAEGQGAHITA